MPCLVESQERLLPHTHPPVTLVISQKCSSEECAGRCARESILSAELRKLICMQMERTMTIATGRTADDRSSCRTVIRPSNMRVSIDPARDLFSFFFFLSLSFTSFSFYEGTNLRSVSLLPTSVRGEYRHDAAKRPSKAVTAIIDRYRVAEYPHCTRRSREM